MSKKLAQLLLFFSTSSATLQITRQIEACPDFQSCNHHLSTYLEPNGKSSYQKICPNSQLLKCRKDLKYQRQFFCQQKLSDLKYSNSDLGNCRFQCFDPTNNAQLNFGSLPEGTECLINGRSDEREFGVCSRGSCKPIDCHGKVYDGENFIEKRMKFDNCKICGGDSSKCQGLTERFDSKNTKAIRAYNQITVIPKGSTNIKIDKFAFDVKCILGL